jgi:hypothetical protein
MLTSELVVTSCLHSFIERRIIVLVHPLFLTPSNWHVPPNDDWFIVVCVCVFLTGNSL